MSIRWPDTKKITTLSSLPTCAPKSAANGSDPSKNGTTGCSATTAKTGDPRTSPTAAGEGCSRPYAELVKEDAERDKQIQVIAHRGLHAQQAQHRDCAA